MSNRLSLFRVNLFLGSVLTAQYRTVFIKLIVFEHAVLIQLFPEKPVGI